MLILASLLLTQGNPSAFETRKVEGWTVKISQQLKSQMPEKTDKALKILASQLAEIKEVVPAAAVQKLTGVVLWFTPEHEGAYPGAAYHPSREWLVQNKRNPELARSVEFFNIRIFEEETRRMPAFVLHELAHAYHHQFLKGGFDNSEIKAAWQKAKESKSYENVEKQDAEGKRSRDTAYAMTNPQEYFAELTEAWFGTNDFFPFNWTELKHHDSQGEEEIRKAWGIPAVSPLPLSLPNRGFYKQFADAGIPVVASDKVNSRALEEAAFLINKMIGHKPELVKALALSGSRFAIKGINEFTTDIPEYAWLTPKEFWDKRARGLGGSETDPLCSCGEENLLNYPGDPYGTENILIHEFAHSIHLRGMKVIDPTFDKRLKAAFDASIAKGLWAKTYAAENHGEWFAEGTQSWFDSNRELDSYHNFVNTRAELKAYDPVLAALCEEVYGDRPWRWTKAVTRLTGHLKGWDPSKSPTFRWP